MAGPGPALRWYVGTVTAVRDESATARTLVLDVPDWPGSRPGQHVDVRLTAPDGYSTRRSYSIASAPDARRVELTVEELADGEVSPYLARVVEPGDRLELRGPIGGWFVWDGGPTPVNLVAGGSGLVPLMSMIRARDAVADPPPFSLVYSVRGPGALLYREELARRADQDAGLHVTYVYTREAPEGGLRPPGRLMAAELAAALAPATDAPLCYVCGPTGFVEAVADLLVGAGHDAARVRTERFGPSAA